MDLKKKPHGTLAKAIGYSGMAAAFLLQHEAVAQVTYTDLDPDVSLHNDTLNIDLDGDGTTDISVREESYMSSFNARVDLPPGNAVSAMATFSGNISPRVLQAGDPIGSANPNFQEDNDNGLVLGQYFSTFFGNWLGAAGYVGCRFIAGDGQPHFAWLELEVALNAETAVVKAYGYEQMPATGILAGEGSPAGISGPGATALLSISPNPAQDLVTITLPRRSAPPVNIALLDPLGKLRTQRGFRPGEPLQLDLNGLPSGVYFLRVSQGDRTYPGRIVKQ